ncbi:MAG: amidohydrolase family protein, partial [Acidobacteria bacterium]|nr:amidohydrolase family protein [Acidobacteriota bacterium]
QRISREDALRLFTRNAAFALFEEKTRGSLEPGKLADMVVLSDDLLTCPEDRLRQIQAALTMVDGRIVHEAR